MDEDEKNALKDVAKISGDSMGNFWIALLLSFGIQLLLSLLGVPHEVASTISFGLLLGLIFGEPLAVWRGERSWRRFAFYCGAGVGISALIDLAVFVDPDTYTATETATGETVVTEEPGIDFPWFILIIFLTGPLVFALPLLEKLLRIEKDAPEVSGEDLAIAAAFPIMMSVTIFLNLAVPGALWLIGAPLWLAAATYLAGIVLVVADVAYSPEEDSARDTMEEWGPRPETAAESWANLRKGIGQSIASGLFMGSTIYLSLVLADPEQMGGIDDDGLAFLWGFFAFAALMLVCTLLLMGLGSVLAMALSVLIGRQRFNDPMSVVELAQRSSGRLFAGGMSWVRPDLPEDSAR